MFHELLGRWECFRSAGTSTWHWLVDEMVRSHGPMSNTIEDGSFSLENQDVVGPSLDSGRKGRLGVKVGEAQGLG